MSEAVIPGPRQAEVVAFGHFHPQVLLTGVSPRAFDQQGLRTPFGNNSDALGQSSDIDVVPDSLRFIDCAPHAVPFQSCQRLPVVNKDMTDAAVALALDQDLPFPYEISLVWLTGRRSQDLSALLHRFYSSQIGFTFHRF